MNSQHVFQAWFDEQSPKLLQGLSENTILSAGGQQECLSLLDMLKEPSQTIFIWLLELLVDVNRHEDANGVTLAELGMFILLRSTAGVNTSKLTYSELLCIPLRVLTPPRTRICLVVSRKWLSISSNIVQSYVDNYKHVVRVIETINCTETKRKRLFCVAPVITVLYFKNLKS